MKKQRHKHSKLNVPALDCAAFGCMPEANEPLKPWLGAWNSFEKNRNGKIWIFQIFVDGCRIQYRVALKGAKSRLVDVFGDTEDETLKKFRALIKEKEQEGYRLINVKL